MDLSIVIPTYDEEDRIRAVLNDYSQHFTERLKKDYEIIVVCNGCTDETPQIVKEFEGMNPCITSIRFHKKLGKGGAIKEGFEVAKGDYVGFIDCDKSLSPEEFEKLFLTLRNGNYCGTIASRRVKDSKILIQQPMKRRITSKAFNVMVRLMFDLSFRDTQCGAKIFKREPIKKLLPKFKSNGFEFDVELLWRLKKENCKIKESPVTWRYKRGSKFSLWNAPEMFFRLFLIRLGD